MKLFLFSIIILFNSPLFAKWGQERTDRNPFFMGYETDKFLSFNDENFSTHDFEVMKKLGVKSVSYFEKKTKNYFEKVEYLFDERGNIISKSFFASKNNNKVYFQKSKYKYDEMDRLILSMVEFVRNEIYYDSIIFDSDGKIKTIISEIRKWEKKLGYRIDYSDCFSLGNVSKDKYQLTSKNGAIIYLNFNNQIQFSKVSQRSDSIEFTIDSLGNSIKNFWYKYESDSIYNLGLQKLYKNETIVKETEYHIFNHNLKDIRSKKYVYDESNNIKITYIVSSLFPLRNFPIEMFFYKENGLKQKQLKYLKDKVEEKYYFYTFF